MSRLSSENLEFYAQQTPLPGAVQNCCEQLLQRAITSSADYHPFKLGFKGRNRGPEIVGNIRGPLFAQFFFVL